MVPFVYVFICSSFCTAEETLSLVSVAFINGISSWKEKNLVLEVPGYCEMVLADFRENYRRLTFIQGEKRGRRPLNATNCLRIYGHQWQRGMSH